MKICTVNARGLGEKRKRRSMFTFLKKQKPDIVMLQETHLCTEQDKKSWELEWGGTTFASMGTNNSRGVSILLNSKSNAKIDEIKTDNDGRIICGIITVDNKRLLICNIYAPNSDNPEFFEQVIRMTESYTDHDGLIMGGDFYLVIDPKLDRNKSDFNHWKSVNVIKEFMEKTNLCDTWRLQNPQGRRYTWYRWGKGHKPTCSRIDMILSPLAYNDCIEESLIQLGHLTDHSLVSMQIRTDEFIRGPGIWKFNNKLLHDSQYCDGVISKIKDTGVQTVALNPNDRWETVKMHICNFSKSYSKRRAAKDKDETEKLRLLQISLEEDLTNNPDNDDIFKNLTQVKADLRVKAIADAEKTIFCSKCNYAKEGEKCSSYFFSLEKRRNLEKNMKSVILDSGKTTCSQKRILNEQTKFYKELYCRDSDVSFHLSPDRGERRITDIDRINCDSDFKPDEFFDAAMTLKSEKVPGLDGLTIEFYRKFWKHISVFLIEMYQFSYENGELPNTVKQGLISLLSKPNRDPRYIRNKRPLTLLQNDYKILAKAIDNRMRMILPNLIDTDQNGIVKGRKICHNVRRSLDLIEFTKRQKIPALILTIDMEKMF